MSDFWKRFDAMVAEAKLTEVGKIMTAAGFTVQHTGGNCLAWEKCTALGKHFVWVCDGGNGIVDAAPGEADWLVGLYDYGGLWDGNWFNEGGLTLDAAIRWANDAIYAMEVV